MWDVHRVIRNVSWDICTGLSEMWDETCAQGCQKCDMIHVHRVIRNMTWDMCTGLLEMWHDIRAQGYQKCVMRHVHRVIRNVTWDMRSVMMNVTWDTCTGLLKMWHQTCAQGYQKSLFIMNNHLPFWGLYVYVYQATDTIIYQLLSQITKFPLSLHHTVTAVTSLTFVLWLC